MAIEVSSHSVLPQLHTALNTLTNTGGPPDFWVEEPSFADGTDLGSRRFPASPLAESVMIPLSPNQHLCVIPGQRMPRAEFERRISDDKRNYDFPEDCCVIALDGVLNEPPFIDWENRIVNLDHHKGVDRIQCPCSAAQAAALVRSGDLEKLTDHGRRPLVLYSEDADLDVVLGVWSLEDAALLRLDSIYSRVRPLLELEDRLDRWCGASAISPHDPLVRQMAWINEPFVQAQRHAHFMHDAQTMGRVLCEVRDRIRAHVFGCGSETDLNTTYSLIPMDDRWAVLREHGYYARGLACTESLDALLSVRGIGRQRVTFNLFRTRPHSDFPIAAVQDELNRRELEASGATPARTWGGAKDMFTASPRLGSLLSLSSIIDGIQSVVRNGNRHT